MGSHIFHDVVDVGLGQLGELDSTLFLSKSIIHSLFQFGGSEAIITALSDEFPKIGKNREVFVAGLFSLYFVVGLASCTQGGFYFFQLLDKYAAGYSILVAVFFEAIAVSWIYGELHTFLIQHF